MSQTAPKPVSARTSRVPPRTARIPRNHAKPGTILCLRGPRAVCQKPRRIPRRRNQPQPPLYLRGARAEFREPREFRGDSAVGEKPRASRGFLQGLPLTCRGISNSAWGSAKLAETGQKVRKQRKETKINNPTPPITISTIKLALILLPKCQASFKTLVPIPQQFLHNNLSSSTSKSTTFSITFP